MAPPKINTVATRDFTGGLSLAPAQELAPNEVAFARDVDFSQRGGFTARGGFRPFSASKLQASTFIAVFGNVHLRDDGVTQLFGLGVGTSGVYWSSGGQWFTTGMFGSQIITWNAGSTTAPQSWRGPSGTQFGSNSYFVGLSDSGGASWSFQWNGYTALALGASWDNNINAPSGTNMPRANVVAAKGAFVFIGNTREDDGLYHGNRLRWCHPGRPTSWRLQDFIDFPATITALVPYRDFLAVFTNEGLYGLFGEDTDSFSQQPIDTTTGTPFVWSVASAPGQMYWWDWDQGVMQMTGQTRPVSIFDKLKPGLQSGLFGSQVDIGNKAVPPVPPNLVWNNGKLYVFFSSSDGLDEQQFGLTFVYDPRVGKGGCWTTYDMAHPAGQVQVFSAAAAGAVAYPRPSGIDWIVSSGYEYPYVLNDPAITLDTNLSGNAFTDQIPPRAAVKTAPFAGDTNVTKKRWRRPRLALRTSSSMQGFRFGYLKNYEEVSSPRLNSVLMDSTATLGANSGLWCESEKTDAFGSNDTTFWSGFTANVLTTGGQLSETSSGGTFVALQSIAEYDLTDMAISVQTTQQPAGAGAIQWLYANNGSDLFYIEYAATGGFLNLGYTLGGVNSNLSITFNGGTMAYWRIREKDGTIFWETSPDGTTWTTRRSENNPGIDLHSVGIKLALTPATASTTAKFDNFALTFTSTTEVDRLWDQALWAYDADSGADAPDDYITFVTLPSAGAGNAFQLYFTYKGNTGTVHADNTNDLWGVDSIVLPYREKGIR